MPRKKKCVDTVSGPGENVRRRLRRAGCPRSGALREEDNQKTVDNTAPILEQ